MKYSLNSKEMSLCDRNTIEKHKIPALVLMERAAISVCRHIELDKHILVVCGTGNNGADGLAVARLLFLDGADVKYFIIGDISKASPEFKTQLDICKSYNVPYTGEFTDIDRFDVIVDAIFGIGLSRSLSQPFTQVINEINKSGKKVISIDIPSGLMADDGRVMSDAIIADITVTFGFIKSGLLLGEGKKYSGDVIVEAIGIDNNSLYDINPKSYIFENSDLQKLNKPSVTQHKNSCGRLLVIAGSMDMEGAAYLCAKAAMKSGCGILTIYTHESNVSVLHMQFPEAIVKGYKSPSQDDIINYLNHCDAVLIGPGLSVSQESEKIVTTVMKYSNVPMVIDADALNIISAKMSLLDGLHPDIIITPHIGEMSRLTGESSIYISEHQLNVAVDFANKYQLTVVLKSHTTVIAHPYKKSCINAYGNCGMATAGSGDVLAGLIAGMLCQGNSSELSSDAGVFIHSKAADNMIKYTGLRGLMASDIINGIDGVLNEY